MFKDDFLWCNKKKSSLQESGVAHSCGHSNLIIWSKSKAALGDAVVLLTC